MMDYCCKSWLMGDFLAGCDYNIRIAFLVYFFFKWFKAYYRTLWSYLRTYGSLWWYTNVYDQYKADHGDVLFAHSISLQAYWGQQSISKTYQT